MKQLIAAVCACMCVLTSAVVKADDKPTVETTGATIYKNQVQYMTLDKPFLMGTFMCEYTRRVGDTSTSAILKCNKTGEFDSFTLAATCQYNKPGHVDMAMLQFKLSHDRTVGVVLRCHTPPQSKLNDDEDE